ncbi:hypothetical protein BMETH_125811332143, partial [methanotrophic bacterial endosymbiont of Bathymodiolus sp.]
EELNPLKGAGARAVLQGINAWRFEPAKYEGKKVKVWAKQKNSL